MLGDDDVIMDDEACELMEKQATLLDAVTNHNCALVHDLIHRYGLSPNFNIDGQYPVCRAANLGFIDILDILVEGACDLNVANSDNDIWRRQPVHIAASKGHIDFVKRLLEYGVDINCRDDDERTPLHWSATYGDNEMTEFLIAHGASVNKSQGDGFTPLHAASCLGHSEVCKTLLQHGADLHRTDRDGWSAFHTSVCYGHVGVVQTMLDAGASITSLTNERENVIHIAASSGKVEVAKLLVQKGVTINDLNINGNSPFYLAVYYNEFEVAKYLAKAGANLYLPDPKKSPFHLAAMRGLKDFMALFLESGYNLSSEEWILQKDFPSGLHKSPELCNFLYKLATNPRSLKDICRSCVRHSLKHSQDFEVTLRKLELPSYLCNYISYESPGSIFRTQQPCDNVQLNLF